MPSRCSMLGLEQSNRSPNKWLATRPMKDGEPLNPRVGSVPRMCNHPITSSHVNVPLGYKLALPSSTMLRLSAMTYEYKYFLAFFLCGTDNNQHCFTIYIQKLK
jgi:hypothetical protein